MRKKVVMLLLAAVASATVHAQQLSELYYAENPADPAPEAILSDTLLFYRPIVSALSFYDEARYAFGFVAYDYRAEEAADVRYFVGNNRLQNPFSLYTDYATLNIMRRAPTRQTLYAYSSADLFAPSGRAERFDPNPSALPQGSMVRTIYSERGYRGGAVGRHVGRWGRWDVAFSGGGRAGGCKTVRGVETGEWFATAATCRTFADSSTLLMTLSSGVVRRGGRGSTTAEVFALSGDEYYNPSVGTMNGRLRNSRTTFDCAPVATAAYSFEVLERRFEASLLLRGGEDRRSAVGWSDAPSPMPDYYAYLPSRFDDAHVAEAVEDAWAEGDVRYTTLNWDEMCRVNRLSADGAKYTLYDRVERNLGGEFSLTGSHAEQNGFAVRYGLSFSHYRSRFFKRMTDLLGGGEVSDVDSFVEDELSGKHIRNNTLDVGRKVAEGDEFGYNYIMRRSAAIAAAAIRYRKGRFDLSAVAEAQTSTMWREGLYRKENRPDGYGSSRKLRFTTLSVKSELRYRSGGSTNLSASLFYCEREPFYGNIFVAPEQSNDVTGTIMNARRFGGEVAARFASNGLHASLSLYAVGESDRTEIARFYNDLSRCYCDMTVGGLRTLRCGVETAFEADLGESWAFTALLALGSWRYTAPARVDIVSDSDGSALLTGSSANLTGRPAASSPSLTASVKLQYRLFSGWRLGFETVAVGLRRMKASVLYFTPQVLAAAVVSDTAEEFTAERSLPSAVVANLSVYRRFALRYGSLTLSAQLRNIMDKRVVYSAYQSSRVAVSGTAAARCYRPFEIKYTHAYPRNLYIAIGYEF